MENTGFNGGLVAWLLGLPFIAFIILTQKERSV